MPTLKKPPLAGSIYFLIFTGYALRMSVVPYMNGLRQQFLLTYSETGLIFSAFMVGYIALRLLGGVWADRRGSRRVLLIGSALAGLGQIIQVVLPGYGWMLAGRLVTGTGAGLVYTASVRALAIEYRNARRGLAMGILQSAVGAGTLFALIYPSLLPAEERWDTAVLVYPILALGGIVASWIVPHQIPAAPRSDERWMGSEWAGVALLSTVAFLQLFSLTAGLAWLPTYFEQRFAVSASVSGVLSSFSSIVLALLAVFAGRLLDVWPASRRMMALGCVLTGLGYSCLLVDSGLGVAIAALIPLGLGLALFLPALTLGAVDTLGAERSGVSSGITGTAAQVGVALSGVAVGWLVDRTGGLAAAWGACIGASLMAFVLLMFQGFVLRPSHAELPRGMREEGPIVPDR